MSDIPMDWEYTDNQNENDIKRKSTKIYNRVAPQECFNKSINCTINKNDEQSRQLYFEIHEARHTSV